MKPLTLNQVAQEYKQVKNELKKISLEENIDISSLSDAFHTVVKGLSSDVKRSDKVKKTQTDIAERLLTIMQNRTSLGRIRLETYIWYINHTEAKYWSMENLLKDINKKRSA